jgi:hypothetical protein
MSAVILIAAVIVGVTAVVLLNLRLNKRRAASHHIGLPALGSLLKAERTRRRRSAPEDRGGTVFAAAAGILSN